MVYNSWSVQVSYLEFVNVWSLFVHCFVRDQAKKYAFSELRFVPGKLKQHKIRSNFFLNSLSNLKDQNKLYLMVYNSWMCVSQLFRTFGVFS